MYLLTVIETEVPRRLLEYLSDVYGISGEVRSRFIILDGIFKEFDEIIKRYSNRIFFLKDKLESIEEIAEKLEGKVIRVQAYKNEEYYLDELSRIGIQLSPKEFTHILFIFKKYYGIFPKEFFLRKEFYKKVSKAYYKVYEAVRRFKIPLSKDWTVLDLGAAPGGWTQFFSERVRRVVSVDPAELKVTGKNIVHIKKKAEESLEEIEQYSPYDLIACDINDDPRNVSRLLLKISEFLKENGFLLMTIKLVYKSRKGAERLIRETVDILRDCYEIIGVKWLVTNSKNERCLFGKKV